MSNKHVQVWTDSTPGRLMAIFSEVPQLAYIAMSMGSNGQFTAHVYDLNAAYAELDARNITHGLV
jgi:hypothetical protein